MPSPHPVLRDAYHIDVGPPAFLDLGEILEILNRDRATCGLEPRDRWWARRICEAMGIRFIQRAPRCKLIASGTDLKRSGFWDALDRHRRGVDEEHDEEATG